MLVMILQQYIFVTDRTKLSSSSTLFYMGVVQMFGNLLLAKLAYFRLGCAWCLVLINVFWWKLGFTISTSLFRVKLLLMIFLIVDVVHLTANSAHFDISLAIWKVTIYLRLRIWLPAVFTFLHDLRRHWI